MTGEDQLPDLPDRVIELIEGAGTPLLGRAGTDHRQRGRQIQRGRGQPSRDRLPQRGNFLAAGRFARSASLGGRPAISDGIVRSAAHVIIP